MRRTLSCTVAFAFALAPLAVNAQQVAGQVIWTAGELVSINPNKVVRPLAKGDAVREGELISTGPDSYAHILMKDQGLIALRPDSSLLLSSYAYRGRNDGSEHAVMKLVKGGMRSITGAIGESNKDNYQLKTDAATVGIRGTDHETFVVAGGTYNRVTLGGTYLQGADGRRIDLEPGELGFAGKSAAPMRMSYSPDWMHMAAFQRAHIGPALRGKAAGDERRLQAPQSAASLTRTARHGKHKLPDEATVPVLPPQALGESGRPDKTSGKGNRKHK